MRLNSQAFVRAEIADGLPDVVVRTSVPNPRPDYFVLVKREGGGRKDKYRDGPGIGVFCWAPTEEKAADLAERVSQVMFSLELKHGVSSVTEEILTSAPDPVDSSPRWYGSYTLITYEI